MDTSTDGLVLQLADLENIVAVRERTQDPANSPQWEKATRVTGLRREMAEEIYRLEPDLICFGPWSGRATRDMLKQLGAPVARLGSVAEWQDVYATIHELGGMLGEEERANALVGEIETRLREVAERLEGRDPLRGVCFLGQGRTYGSGSKPHFVMESAGIRNLAAEKGATGLGYLSVEELLLIEPDILIFFDYHKDTPTLSRQILEHPAIARLASRAIVIELPSSKINSSDASLVDCVEILARAAHPEAFIPLRLASIDE